MKYLFYSIIVVCLTAVIITCALLGVMEMLVKLGAAISLCFFCAYAVKKFTGS